MNDTDEDDEEEDEIPPESERVIHKWRWVDVEEQRDGVRLASAW